eukprot:evm.model.scf_1429.6 EVM.evm.TU.scf_1429.6   scf_1429:28202-29164(+)
MSAFQIVFCRSFPNFIISCILARLWGVRHTLGERKHTPLLLLRGVLGSTAIFLLYLAVLRMPLADANTLFLTNAAFTALLGWTLRIERINWQLAAGILICTAGAVLVSHPPFLFGGHQDWSHGRVMGVVFVELSALTGAAAFLLIGVIGTSISSVTVMAWFHLVSSISAVIPMCLGFPKPLVVDIAAREWLSMAGLVVASLTGQLFLTRGMQICRGPKGTTLNTTQVIYSHILGFAVFSEVPTFWSIGGSVLVASGAILVAWGKASRAGKDAGGVGGEEEHFTLEMAPVRDAQGSGEEVALSTLASTRSTSSGCSRSSLF